MIAGRFGLGAGVVSAVAILLYIRGTLRGDQPQRVSWVIFTADAAVLFVAQWRHGARSSLWILLPQVAGTLVVMVLSWKRGKGDITRLDVVLLCAAVDALALTWLARLAQAIVLATGAELIGVFLSARDVRGQPGDRAHGGLAGVRGRGRPGHPGRTRGAGPVRRPGSVDCRGPLRSARLAGRSTASSPAPAARCGPDGRRPDGARLRDSGPASDHGHARNRRPRRAAGLRTAIRRPRRPRPAGHRPRPAGRAASAPDPAPDSGKRGAARAGEPRAADGHALATAPVPVTRTPARATDITAGATDITARAGAQHHDGCPVAVEEGHTLAIAEREPVPIAEPDTVREPVPIAEPDTVRERDSHPLLRRVIMTTGCGHRGMALGVRFPSR